MIVVGGGVVVLGSDRVCGCSGGMPVELVVLPSAAFRPLLLLSRSSPLLWKAGPTVFLSYSGYLLGREILSRTGSKTVKQLLVLYTVVAVAVAVVNDVVVAVAIHVVVAVVVNAASAVLVQPGTLLFPFATILQWNKNNGNDTTAIATYCNTTPVRNKNCK